MKGMSFLQTCRYAERYASRLSRASRCHGPRHWRDVARLGRVIALADPRVDPEIVLLFAAFHDTRRQNEHRDPEHGPLAADRVALLSDQASLPITPEQAAVLFSALRLHDQRLTSNDPTVGACWDADRLTLGRVGTVPDPELLSNSVVRANTTIFIRLGYQQIEAWDYAGWDVVVAEYGL